MRPGWGPVFSIRAPTGTVLQAESACATAPWDVPAAVRFASTSVGGPYVLPPSVEMFTQIWLGPKKS